MRSSGPRNGRSGAFIVLVGPDGVGKTTVARSLLEQYGGPSAYFHFLPPMGGDLAPGPPPPPPPHPKPHHSGVRFIGWLRLARNIARFWLGYLTTVRPAMRRGSLVVGDRGLYGYLVQPHPLKFYGPRRLAAALLRVLPRPDLVVNLTAPAEVIASRKQDLTHAQIARELVAWGTLPAPRVKTVDAVRAPAAIAREILEAL